MKRRIVILAGIFGTMALTTNDAAAVPNTVNFTGRITQNGTPLPDGTVNLSFELFDAPVAGSSTVWSETYGDTPVVNGLVFIPLGSQNGLSDEEFDGSDVYLEITVNGDVQSPRIPIGSSPYAFRSSTADKLGTLRPGDVALSDHGHSDLASSNHTHGAPTCQNASVDFSVPAGGDRGAIALCPSGSTLTGGGCTYAGFGQSNRQVMASYPHPNGGWHCLYWNSGSSPYDATAFARCCQF